MGSKVLIILLSFSVQIVATLALTDSNDLAALTGLKSTWKNLPPNWKGSDPCGSNWEGITCNDSRIISIKLAGMGLEGSSLGDISTLTELQFLDLSNNIGLRGSLPSSIGNLKNLTILILINCGFNGPIPDSIGSLPNLIYLSLNSNNFNGPIPPSIGNLTSLSWLDLSGNKLSGTIPISNETAPGLDMLLNTKHFHLSKNQLSGLVTPQLFSSDMNLIHVILDNNQLTGNIPSTLGLVKTLEVIHLDWNLLNGSVPSNLNNLTSLNELYLSNNALSGPIPNLTGMNQLFNLDISNNSFQASAFPAWLSSTQSLTTLIMEDTQLQGQIPVDFFSLPQLESVVLKNNQLNGTLNLGTAYSSSMALDLQNNSITGFQQQTGYSLQELKLSDNPICQGNGGTQKFCGVQNDSNIFSLPNNCSQISCNSNKGLSPNCKCSNPYIGTLHFFSYSFSNLDNSSYVRTLWGSLMSIFLSNGLPVDSVNLSIPSIDAYSYLQFRLEVFPSGQDSFNRSAISNIGFVLNRQPFQLDYFGPFFFIDESYCCFSGDEKSSTFGVIVGAIVGGVVFFILLLCGGFYAYQRKRASRYVSTNDPFANWDPNQGNGGVPELKGARWFSFQELRNCTGSFPESNCIGIGGYGKVYKGILPSGQSVAIKRAQQGSMQGALEFKTEIELLSRIHHRNVVSLLGFCYDQGEQMLVYEYISNGTLRESLSGKSEFPLDWIMRLRIALDAAKGLTYLHELANPPIIHRDIKSNNILLDDHFNAKVADFGLSKLLGDEVKGYVSTQVKGTLGYMDPEYYMTQQLTEKSDVYSFGVVLLELVSGRIPIERGKHIVRIFQEALDNPKDASKLYQILDPKIIATRKPEGVEKFVDLARRCVRDSGSDRPTMSEVAREIESIMQLASLNKKSETKFSSFSSEDTTDVSLQQSHGSNDFKYSGGLLPFNVENH